MGNKWENYNINFSRSKNRNAIEILKLLIFLLKFKRYCVNYNLEITYLINSAVASQYNLAKESIFASLITLIIGSVFDG